MSSNCEGNCGGNCGGSNHADNLAESLSSVKLSRNAKGGIQYEIKVYHADPQKAFDQAVELQNRAENQYPAE